MLKCKKYKWFSLGIKWSSLGTHDPKPYHFDKQVYKVIICSKFLVMYGKFGIILFRLVSPFQSKCFLVCLDCYILMEEVQSCNFRKLIQYGHMQSNRQTDRCNHYWIKKGMSRHKYVKLSHWVQCISIGPFTVSFSISINVSKWVQHPFPVSASASTLWNFM